MSNHDQPPMVVPPSHHPELPSFTAPSPMDYGYVVNQGVDLREYLHILLKRKWMVIGIFIGVFLAGALYTFTRTPIFRTSATLQITQDNPGSQLSMNDTLSKLTGSDSLEKFQQTQYQILQSRSLAQRVVRALHLQDSPDFKFIRKENQDYTDADVEDAITKLVQKKIEVTPIRNSYLVKVEFQSPDKMLSKRVVKAISDQYMYLCMDRRNESYSLVRKWLNRQLQEMGAKVESAQKKLYKFGQKTNIYSLDDRDNIIVQKFLDLSSLLTKAQAEKMAKEAQYQQIKAEGPNAPLIVNNPLVAALRQQVVAEEAKVSGMQKVLGADHPDLLAERANLAELRTRLQTEVQRIEESVKADYEAANRTENLLSESFAEQKGQMAKLQDNLTNYQILKRDAQTNEQLYQALLSRVKEASIASTMVPSNVAVIDPAELPKKPFKPKTKRDLALAAVLGLVMGVGLALLREHMDDSIKSLDDLERACSLPALGILPVVTNDGKGSIGSRQISRALALSYYLPSVLRGKSSNGAGLDIDLNISKHPQSRFSEAIHHIDTSLMLSTSGQPPRAIVITSPNPNEGKSMLVSNLALSYALNARQTVVIDCDLRKPRLHRIFEVETQPGLSNFLSRNAELADILQATGIPNLTVITAGTRSPNPVNLLKSEIFKKILTQLRQQFSHIIIDTPPVLGFTDARIVSALVDGALLVARYNVTRKDACLLAHQLLSPAPVLGGVLNAVDVHGQTYGGYYHYKYYSKYYENEDQT